MPIDILADENVHAHLIRDLRKSGFNVLSIREKFKGMADVDILALARKQHTLLVTEDSDFGEWIFAHKEKNVGVVFLRYKAKDLPTITKTVLGILEKYGIALFEKFIVVTPRKIRIRSV